MPRMSNTYVHRVGRTARAGCGGRAVTVVSDSRRKVMKEILKGDEGTKLSQDGGQILTRSVAAAVIDGYIAKIQGMENEIESSMIKERQLQKIDEMTRDVEKVENLMTFQDEIKARPVRTWFQTETQKLSVREASREKVKEEEGIAKLGKDGYLRKRELTTAELARRDDYRLEGKDAKRAQDHRLSRVKRRRLEALKDDRGENDDGDDGHSHSHGDDSGDSGDKPKAFDVKMSAKRAKVSKRETQKVVNDLSVSDISRKRNDKRNEASRSDSRKNHRPIIATGGLDADMREWGMMKSSDVMSKKQIGRLVHMKDELRSIEEKSGRSVSSRKHVKPTLKSFKSKGRYKRR
jgi:superfamily II DNA/RNA helicase